MRRHPIVLGAVAASLLATVAAAQTSVPGSPGGTAGNPGGIAIGGPGGQLLNEGFFGPTSGAGGTGPGGVGSPINTRPASGVGLFGPGGLWSGAHPVQTPPNGNGVQRVESPNGTVNGSAPGAATATTTAKPGFGGAGPRRFLGL